MSQPPHLLLCCLDIAFVLYTLKPGCLWSYSRNSRAQGLLKTPGLFLQGQRAGDCKHSPPNLSLSTTNGHKPGPTVGSQETISFGWPWEARCRAPAQPHPLNADLREAGGQSLDFSTARTGSLLESPGVSHQHTFGGILGEPTRT